MLVYIYRLLVVMMLLFIMTVNPVAIAVEIATDDPLWNALTEAQQAEIIKKLRGNGVLEPGDTVIYNGRPDTTIGEKNTGPGAGIPALMQGICKAKPDYAP